MASDSKNREKTPSLLVGILTKSCPSFLAISTLGIAQPLLEIYSKNLAVFAAAKMSRFESWLFLALVLFGPTAIAATAELVAGLVGSRARKYTHAFFLGLLTASLGLALTRHFSMDRDEFVYPAVVLGGALLAVLNARISLVPSFLRYLAISAPLVGGLFVLNAWPVLASVDAPYSGSTVKADTPVLLLVMDEFPLFSILDEKGNINAERFPGFAKLAASSTWHRNATSVSNFTHQAVPAILTSSVPEKDDQPLLLNHKRNIFTLIGDAMPLGAFESVTSLCPKGLCTLDPGMDSGMWNYSRFSSFFSDARIVYQRRVLPMRSRERLPRTDQGWGGFGAVAERFKENIADGPYGQLEHLKSAVARIVETEPASAQVVHMLAPHQPWLMLPDGRASTGVGFTDPMNAVSGDSARENYQRFLYQLGAVDDAIGEMVDTFKSAGIWDKAVVVVTADHGISFQPGQRQRNSDLSEPGQVEDLYRIPMFMKLPGSQAGEVTDCTVNNFDIVPTIADALEMTTDWKFKGKSAYKNCSQRGSRLITTPEMKSTIATTFADVQERSDYYDKFVSRAGGFEAVAKVGKSASLVGTTPTVTNKDTVISRWSINEIAQLENVTSITGEPVPVVVSGSVKVSTATDEATEGLVTLDGKVVGVVGELSQAAAGMVTFSAVLDYASLTPGKHTVGFLMARHGSGTPVITSVTSK